MYFKRIKELRIDNDKKQIEIAKILGIKQPQYVLYENGKRTIQIDYLLKLADYYNTTTDYILGRTNKK